MVCDKCGGSEFGSHGCKACWSAYMREWSARNPDKVKASRRRKDPVKLKAARDRDRQKHKAKRYAARDACQAKKPEHYSAYKKAWYRANKERMLKICKEAAARRRAADPEGFKRKRAEYAARRRKENPHYLIYGRMSSLIRAYLKNKKRNGSKAGKRWVELVGYTLEELIAHLKTTIPEGYTWDDYLSRKLEVDHIIPDKDFNYSTVDNPEFKESWSLKNLRLLPREENSNRRYKE